MQDLTPSLGVFTDSISWSDAAIYKFCLKKTDPLGTYEVGANADLKGVSGTASTSFCVSRFSFP